MQLNKYAILKNLLYMKKEKLMSNIWVISDTHFFHENILKFTDSTTGELVRGGRFSSVNEMNECMLDNWNSVVSPGDKVYHLGDVTMGHNEEFLKFWPKLNGSKRLIVGNHDDIKFLSTGGLFAKVQMWRMFPEFGLMFSHVPLHINSLYRYPSKDSTETFEPVAMLNVHGHLHQNPSPEGPYRNVSVEAIDYTPINIEELRII
jgi:calcineurin-like phosphoesterase family protein